MFRGMAKVQPTAALGLEHLDDQCAIRLQPLGRGKRVRRWEPDVATLVVTGSHEGKQILGLETLGAKK